MSQFKLKLKSQSQRPHRLALTLILLFFSISTCTTNRTGDETGSNSSLPTNLTGTVSPVISPVNPVSVAVAVTPALTITSAAPLFNTDLSTPTPAPVRLTSTVITSPQASIIAPTPTPATGINPKPPQPTLISTPTGDRTSPPKLSSSTATSLDTGWTGYLGFNHITDLAFDSDGALWAGTTSGVVHWNLTSDTYVSYTTADGLAADGVKNLIVASDGSLWVATIGGVSRFDGTNWISYTEADGLPANVVYSITMAPDGQVWVGTNGGAARFDGTAWTGYTTVDGLADNLVWYVAATPKGEIWFSTHVGGVSRYNPTQDTWTIYTTQNGLPSPNARFLTVGPDGVPWLHFGYDHVYRFDNLVWQQTYEAGGGQWVCDIAFAGDGTPWLGTCDGYHTYGAGLAHLEAGNWSYTTTGDGLIDNSVTAVAIGVDGSIAAGSDWGLNIYQAGHWRTLRAGPTLNKVTTAIVTPDNALWVGFGDAAFQAAGGGLSRFDGQEWQYFSQDDGFPINNNVRALAVAPDGSLWAGGGCGVARFDGQTWQAIVTCNDISGNINNIAFTLDGVAWIATDFDLYRFDGQLWTTYESKLPTALATAANNIVWVGHANLAGGGISYFNGDTWTTHNNGGPLKQVNSIAVTADSMIWAGTFGQGVVRFDDQSAEAQNKSWINYTTTDGLPSNNIVDLVIDPNDRLWAITDAGLVYFDSGDWIAFDKLGDDVVNTIAFTPEGRIWLGTNHGLIKIDSNIGLPPSSSDQPTTLPPPPPTGTVAVRVEISANSSTVKAGDVMTVTAVSTGISLPYYTLNIDSNPAVTITYDNQIKYQGDTGQFVEYISASATHSQVEFVLQALHPGPIEVNIGATGEVYIDYGGGTGAWSWGGAASENKTITVVE